MPAPHRLVYGIAIEDNPMYNTFLSKASPVECVSVVSHALCCLKDIVR